MLCLDNASFAAAMKLIDTHAHLYDERFDNDREAAIRRCMEAGVSEIYLPNCDSSTIPGMMALAEAHPAHCFPMMGLHPCYVKEDFETELAIVQKWLDARPFSAVGEIGLDYYWDKTHVPQQKEAFRRQIDMALAKDLAIVIHSRESTQDCIDIVREKQDGRLRGIFHCYSGTPEEAREAIELGFFLGIGGVVTYKNNVLQEIVKSVPLEHLVLETDAPYLSSVPYRGKRNESSYIPVIAQKVADLKEVSVEEVARVTTGNASQVFRRTV